MDRSQSLDRDELEKFLASLTDYKPAIPDQLVRYYLSRSGFTTDDVRIQRLISLAAQKFLADIANDAISHSRLRQNATASSRKSSAAAKDPKVTLTVDDLERALREYGVMLRKPPYFADSVTTGVTDSPPTTAKPAAPAPNPPSKPSK